MMSKKSAVVLSSGGVDSTTTIAIARDQGFEVYSLSFNYGQKNQYELACARKVASFFHVQKHLIISLNLRQIGGSALTDTVAVPQNRSQDELASTIPATYVPARNLIFLSVAVAWAESKNITNIFIGVNAVDFSGYPDCRPAFIRSFEQTANLGTRLGVEGNSKIVIHTPLIDLSKKQILQKGLALGVDYQLTSSCYDPAPSGKPCGKCDSCQIRKKGFQEIGQLDPIL